MRKQLKWAVRGVLLLLVSLVVCVVVARVAGWIPAREVKQFKAAHNISPDGSIDRFVVDQFTSGMDRDQVHDKMQSLAPARFYDYKEDPDGIVRESVDLHIGRTMRRTFILSYDERGN